MANNSRVLKKDRLSILCKAILESGGTVPLDDQLADLMQAVFDLTAPEQGMLVLGESAQALANPSTVHLPARTAPTPVEGIPEQIDLTVYRPLVQVVMESKVGLSIDDASKRVQGVFASPGLASSSTTALCSPLCVHGDVIGIIYVQRPSGKGTFTKEHLTMLNAMATHAAILVENAHLTQAVQEAEQAKASYISLVSHELRTPMTTIKGYTDLISKGAVGPVTPKQVNLLKVIRVNVDRMSALVSDLSDISRIESGLLKLQPVFFSLADYVEKSILALRPEIDEMGQSLTLEIPTDLPQAFADTNRFVQIMNVLLSNANTYTPEGGEIRVCASPLGDSVRIEVSDSGAGISTEDQAQVFSPFFRSDDPSVRDLQGWGLGLSVAKGLVELMGGKIGLHSHVGRGSTFWFTLPAPQDNE